MQIAKKMRLRRNKMLSISRTSERRSPRRLAKKLSLESLETRTLLSVSPQLIDLDPATEADPTQFTTVGSSSFFVAESTDYGKELWITDGAPGTVPQVIDIATGTDSSNPDSLVEIGGVLYFAADDGVNGREIWKTDGTPGGTERVTDIVPGAASSNPSKLTNVGGTLYFVADDGINGEELWKSDGTGAGTSLIKDIQTGVGDSDPGELTDVNGTLFFTAHTDASGRELWKSDGTEGGTNLVKDVLSGATSSNLDRFTAVGSTLFFTADDGVNGRELWISNGTEAGTSLLKDIAAGVSDSIGNDSELLEVDGKLFFTADDDLNGDELWKSDGTAEGTVLVKDIYPGAGGNQSYFAGLVDVDGTLFFAADDGTHGKELWKSDGTEGGTVLVKDINPGVDGSSNPLDSTPLSGINIDGTLYFSAHTESTGRELWKSDGTEAGTLLVEDVALGTGDLDPLSLANVNDFLLFSGDVNAATEVWSLPLTASDNANLRLTIYVNGNPVAIPANVGVESDGAKADVFSVEAGGGLYFEPGEGNDLDNFFDAWRTNAGLAGENPDAVLEADQLMGEQTDATHTVQMFVNGHISHEFGEYELQHLDEIVLVYSDNPVVALNTNFGPIVVELFEDETPITVENFLNYFNDGDYIGAFFHRSDPDFMIQGGGFETTSLFYSNASQFSPISTDASIVNEAGISNLRTTISMARTSDPNSATAQFFINLSDDNTFLDKTDTNPGYAVFGQVLDMTTADDIESLPINDANPSPYGELPVADGGELAVILSTAGQGWVSGIKFQDDNANGVQDAGESVLEGVNIYIDANDNGVLDTDEISTTTNVNGEYRFFLEAGTRIIRSETENERVTTMPAPSGKYNVVVEAGREITDLNFGEADLPAPTSVDLLPDSDLGTSDSDDLTNLNNADPAAKLRFLVDGVVSGAEVRLYADGQLIGSATASGTSVEIETDGSTELTDGSLEITAAQFFGLAESLASPILSVTIDTAPAAPIAAPAPATAEVGAVFTFDADSPEENQPGVSYALADPPPGMTIDPISGIVNWTPAIEDAIPTMFEIQVLDEAGNVTPLVVDLNVLGTIPAYYDYYNVDEDDTLTVNVDQGILDNDTYSGTGTLEAVEIAPPSHGSVALNADGSFTYTPDLDFSGEDFFTYQADDDVDTSNISKVIITVANVNDAPVANDDAIDAVEDEALDIDILANDTDVDDDDLTATIISGPANGTLTDNGDGTFNYEPDANFDETDTFTYTLSDGETTSNEAVVTINVSPRNDLPVAVEDAYQVSEDETLVVTVGNGLLANDIDVDTTTIYATIEDLPEHGELPPPPEENGAFTYTPDDNFHGTDTFTYRAWDQDGSSELVSVTITVNSVGDPPTAEDDAYPAPNDGTPQIYDVLENDDYAPDEEETLTITAVTQGTEGGQVQIVDGKIEYTAPADYTGEDTFTYTITDEDQLESEATVTVTVAPPSNNTLAGYVYIDTNYNGIMDEEEVGIPGVQISLDGIDIFDNPVTLSLLTDNEGRYVFDELPGGEYRLTENHPISTEDGEDSSSDPNAVVLDDQITNLVVYDGDIIDDNNFGEKYFLASAMSLRVFSSAHYTTISSTMREIVAQAEEEAGNEPLADAIRGEADLETPVVNQAPTVSDDAYSVAENGTLVIDADSGILTNDEDLDNNVLSAFQLSDPAHGSLTLDADGSFTYEPDLDFDGTDSFTYKADDGLLESDTATVVITVNNEQAPLANDDTYEASQDTTLAVEIADSVLDNDTEPSNDPLTAVLVDNPTNGSLILNDDGTFSYTPSAGFTGSDSFTYRASNGSLESTVATVSITVNNDQVPVADDDSYQVYEDTILNVEIADGVLDNDTDPNDDGLTTILLSDPLHGNLTLNDNGSFSYTPDTDYVGNDSFTYQATDGVLVSNTATVTIEVLNDDAPLAGGDVYSVEENDTLTISEPGVLDNDSDPNDAPLTAIWLDGPANGSINLNDDGSFTYVPNPDYVGEDSFTYKANNGSIDSNSATVAITVTPGPNQAPTGIDDAYDVDKNTELVVSEEDGVLDNDTDLDDEPLTANILSMPTNGTLEFENDGSFIYTPTTDFIGIDTFTYWANDGLANSATTTVLITVGGGPNTAPIVVDDNYDVLIDGTLSVTPNFGILNNDSDPEGNNLAATNTMPPSHGTLTLLPDGSFVYTPTSGYEGTDSFTYLVDDGELLSDEATVSITISDSANQPPTALDDAYNVDEDGTLNINDATGVLDNDTDDKNDPLDAILLSDPSDGTLTLNQDGSFTYTPDSDFSGTDSFTYKASDGWADSEETTVVITVNPGPNEAPTANDDSYNVGFETTLVIDEVEGVLWNDSDPDGDLPTAVQVDPPSSGALTLNENGSFTYVPNADFTGTDSFTYKANDGALDSNEVTVTLNVGTSQNSPPTAFPDSYEVLEGGTLNISVEDGILDNDTDPDGDDLGLLVTIPPTGDLTMNPDGSFLYVHTAEVGTETPDTFVYVATDGNPTVSNSVTVTISVITINEPPTAVADLYNVIEGGELGRDADSGVLANDTDPNDDVLTVERVPDSGPTDGQITLNPDGSFLYTPDSTFRGIDSFSYKAKDAEFYSDPVTVTLRVGENNPPTVVDDVYDVEMNVPLIKTADNGGLLDNDFDLDGDDFVVFNWTQPLKGTINVASDGAFTYTPANGIFGNDEFTYQVRDGHDDSEMATVTLIINAPNDAPDAVADDYRTRIDETLLVEEASGVLDNDSDPNGDDLTAILDVDAQHGNLTLSPDGSFSYEPDPSYEGADSFTYKANDGELDSEVTTVSLTVAANQVPLAGQDAYQTDEGDQLVVEAPGILINDTDGDNDPLAVIPMSSTTGGILDLQTDGSFTYTPDQGFTGEDSFTYKATDNTDDSLETTVTIIVTAEVPALANVRYQAISDVTSLPVTSVDVGDVFWIEVYVQDARDTPEGITAAYIDLSYGSSLVSLTDPETIIIDDQFPINTNSNTITPGFIGEVGGQVDQGTTLGGDEFRLFKAKFQADAVGTVSFAYDPADTTPDHDFTLSGLATALGSDDIDFSILDLDVLASSPADATPESIDEVFSDIIWDE
jgi:ELWxxDGT repeat protein/VCBS repeat-containing protein